MRRSSTPENLLEFICEPQQVLPFATAFSVLNPSTEPILCEPLHPTFAPLNPDPAEDVAAAHYAEGDSSSIRGLLLQPFSKSQLVDLLFSAAAIRPALLDRIRAVARRNPRHRKVFVDQLPPGTTPSALAAALRARFGPDSVEYALVAPGGLCAIVLFRRLCDARRALFSPVGEGLLGAGLFLPLDFLIPPAGRDRRAVVARFAGPRSPERLAELGALLARYGAVAEGPAWAGAWVSGTDWRRTPEPSAAYVVYEDAAAADAALVDNPKVVAGNLVLCERVLHITAAASAVVCRCRRCQ
ncbi:UBP1-associated protein 2B-like [Ananas comosus]|uniref:UBP1-associated protein 2B-like n=1 Tax=Ananas comosus TaxID=4615 RepID=A0A6P5GMH4_ANACO|nr:UBP1-associated protein 2B-like [Ananas comosus]